MTLPFRRRHHDDEAGHERARTLLSTELLEPIGDDESTWLAGHLDGCAACRSDREAFAADRKLLLGLREHAPEPPRDLWAKTSAALDREAAHNPFRDPGPARARGSWGRLPLSAVAGTLVVAVAFVALLWRPSGILPSDTPGASSVAVNPTPDVAPTPISLPANPLSWIALGPDGKSYLYSSVVDEVCPRREPDCRPAQLPTGPALPINLGGKPSAVTMSDDAEHLVFETGGELGAGRILVVPLSEPGPTATPAPTTAPPTSEPPTPGPSTGPSADPGASPSPAVPTPEPTPTGQVEIATGVTVVGDLAYSQDGQWLAFSARPLDGSSGPDLYLWAVGTPSAVQVTTDHRTYFSTWLDNRILASTVQLTETPASTDEPSTEVPVTDAPATEAPTAAAPSSLAPAEPVEANPLSFVLDPATLAVTNLSEANIWLPVVDATGRLVTYWSGTVRSADGVSWELGTGRLLLDRWSNAAGTPTADPSGPISTMLPPIIGPEGAGTEIAGGPTGAFKVRFGPDGTRLAAWIAELPADTIGRLSLFVLDPETGAIDQESAPLANEPALPRFTIELGRLAWVSPDGQDGEQSSVKVLGWLNDDFGEIETLPARDLFIVR